MMASLDRQTQLRLRPLILLALFFLVWAARGSLGDVAAAVALELSHLSAACRGR